jgi:hypothetical protein
MPSGVIVIVPGSMPNFRLMYGGISIGSRRLSLKAGGVRCCGFFPFLVRLGTLGSRR